MLLPGWMWTHGYDYHARDKDRNYVLSSITKPSDKKAEAGLYSWGVKYVVLTAYDAQPQPLNATYLDGKVQRVFQANQFHLFKVKYE